MIGWSQLIHIYDFRRVDVFASHTSKVESKKVELDESRNVLLFIENLAREFLRLYVEPVHSDKSNRSCLGSILTQ